MSPLPLFPVQRVKLKPTPKPNHDQLRHHPDLIVALGEPRVHFTRQGSNQGRARHAPPMEDDVQHPLAGAPLGPGRRDRARAHKRGVLPDELRDRGAGDPVPEPALAPDLADRVRGDDGRVALPLLPTRRAARGVQSHHRRPSRAGRAGRAHHRLLAPHARHHQYPSRAPDWGRRGCAARGD